MTEVKFENTINRLNAVANPRQIERAVRGSKFDLNLIYEVENSDEIVDDMTAIGEGLRLLQYDYLGGHGTRGYGKVKFSDIYLSVVVGEVNQELVGKCEVILTEAISK